MPAQTSAESLLTSLRSQADRFPHELREIEISLAAMEFRRAFDLMTQLRERGLWQPGSEDSDNLEDFWWEYCQ